MRAPGYYWIKRTLNGPGWRIAEVDGVDVFLMGTPLTFGIAAAGWEWGPRLSDPDESAAKAKAWLDDQLTGLVLKVDAARKEHTTTLEDWEFCNVCGCQRREHGPGLLCPKFVSKEAP